jgi:hypothetical protein
MQAKEAPASIQAQAASSSSAAAAPWATKQAADPSAAGGARVLLLPWHALCHLLDFIKQVR